MAVDAWGFDVERQVLARRLRDRRLVLRGARAAVFLAFIALLIAGGSVALRTRVADIGLPGWAAVVVFVSVLFGVGVLLGIPFAYVGNYRWEKAYGLTERSLRSWLRDYAKSVALSFAVAIAVSEVVVWLLQVSPMWWWTVAWALGIAFSIILSVLAPIVLIPMFFRLRPVKDPAVRSRFESLAAGAGTPVVGVFELEASVKTRRSNAAVVGFGRTRRIVVTDTLLQEYSPDEIESVLAHELGHQKFGDPWVSAALGAVVSLVVLASAAAAYGATYARAGILTPGDMAGLPLLSLYVAIASALLGPLELAWSRARERRADWFALEVAKNPGAFASAMVRLHDRNLGVAQPRRWETWLFYSHPPGWERVELARAAARPP